MNPLAEELNAIIKKNNPYIYEMLSELGKKLYFPKGILSQSAEAKTSAYKYNATIGIATEENQPMYLPSAYKYFNELLPSELFDYAPVAGIPRLRQKWKEKMIQENPQLQNKSFSTPIITNALSHGLSIVADLFASPHIKLILPDKIWGNYRLIFEVRKEVEIEFYPFYNKNKGFNIDGFQEILEKSASAGKLLIILNFPNNPTGYSISKSEAPKIVNCILQVAKRGCNVITVLDDAYFGLFYEDETLKESLFGYLADLNKRILAIKIDGATKEEFAWGFRVGFITLGAAETSDKVYSALEKKIMGAIRGNISNCPHPSQTIALKTIESPTFRQEQQAKQAILKKRAEEVKKVLTNPKFDEVWNVYPFNSGYFMCLQLKTVNAESLRKYLLEHYGIGILSINDTDVRIAFSCLELNQIQDLFEKTYEAILALK